VQNARYPRLFVLFYLLCWRLCPFFFFFFTNLCFLSLIFTYIPNSLGIFPIEGGSTHTDVHTFYSILCHNIISNITINKSSLLLHLGGACRGIVMLSTSFFIPHWLGCFSVCYSGFSFMLSCYSTYPYFYITTDVTSVFLFFFPYACVDTSSPNHFFRRSKKIRKRRQFNFLFLEK